MSFSTPGGPDGPNRPDGPEPEQGGGQGYGQAYPGAGSGQPLPVCPRHPDRPSFVRCQRCGRPACPECQRRAEVGIHCVDCAAGRGPDAPAGVGRRLKRRPGVGLARGRPTAPRATYTLIGLCVLVYVLQWATAAAPEGMTERFWYAGVHTSTLAMEPWRMLTSAFLHSIGSPMHILFNLLALWMIGRALEPALGVARFLALYLVSALGGSVAVLWLSDPQVPVVGASGAVYGLFAALFIVLRSTGGNVVSIAVLIGINLLLSFTVSGISWQGHVGGLVVGAACAAVMAYIPRRRSGGFGRQWLALGGIVLVLVVLTGLGAARLTPLAIIA